MITSVSSDEASEEEEEQEEDELIVEQGKLCFPLKLFSVSKHLRGTLLCGSYPLIHL